MTLWLSSPGISACRSRRVRCCTWIDAMLNLSRTSRLPLRLGPVDLGGLVGQVRQEFEPDLLGREVHWNIQELPLVMGDHDTLRQVMLNLLGNALKYTRTRDVTAIRVWVEERAGETAVFVEDNGVGFDARYADKLFGCFSDCTVTRILRAWEWTSRPCAGSCSGMRVRCSRPASLEKGDVRVHCIMAGAMTPPTPGLPSTLHAAGSPMPPQPPAPPATPHRLPSAPPESPAYTPPAAPSSPAALPGPPLPQA
ncbi:ATP-binding protein [Deinococcus malanensis]|uniref:sensor histidine kinase n=1 Tax=Deinococcus malanensis TaxID=1706855 RepID=UPI003643A74C